MKQHILMIITLVVSASVSHAEVEQSVRFYTAGSLVNPSTIALEDYGLIKVFQSRRRNFGTFELITMIKTIAGEMADLFPHRERLQIGDVANQHGGSLGKHKSHQNGLDADIVYFRKNGAEQNPGWVGNFVEKFVVKGAVTKNFDTERNWAMINKLASYPQVQRVFVDIAIKKSLCKAYSKSADPIAQQSLRILRPAVSHDDHMHVRIGCPPGSTRCVSQPPPAPGNGCTPQQMENDLLELRMDDSLGC
jgi:penicillin-insensitive murein endopeptidase